MRTKLLVLATLCVVVLAILMGGCGDSGTSTTGAPSSTLGTTATTVGSSGSTTTSVPVSDREAAKQEATDAGLKDAEAAGPPVAPPTGKKIGFLLLSAQTEADVIIMNDLKEAAGYFGFDVIVSDWNFDTAKLRMNATTVLAQDPDLMIGDAADPTLTPEALKEADARGIPWIVTSAAQTPSDLVTAEYVPDEKLNTRVLDEWLFAQIKERFPDRDPAKLAAFQAPPVGPGVRDRDTQRKEDLANTTGITEVVTHDLDLADPVQDTIKMTRQILAQYPDIAAFWQTADFCIPPIGQVLNSQGIEGAGRPIVSGFYSTREGRAGLIDGSVDGIVDINQGEMAYVIIDQAVEHWARGTEFWPDSTVFAEAYSIKMLQPWMHTAENVNPDIEILENNGADYKTYFKTKWSKEFGLNLQ